VAPLQEEKARADAGVLAAEDRVRTVHERIGKYSMPAPIDGNILRVYADAASHYSTVTPRPLFSLADTSTRHIMAEIGERDVDKVSIGRASPRAIHLARATAISWRP
jgi:multidrug resistance efflux pump